MAEEFIDDIIASIESKEAPDELNMDSSSTESSEKVATNNDSADDAQDNENDQSSNHSKTTIKNEESDQDNPGLSVEELASQLGWRADHEGEDAVDAATYILRSKDIQKSMSKHNKDLKENLSVVQASVEALKEHNERVYKAEVKRLQSEIAALKKERKAAIELADVEKVEELDEQISERQKDIDTPKNESSKSDRSATNELYDEWVKDNQWYENDQEMADYADVVAQSYAGAPIERIYSLVSQKVKEVFPDKFEAPKKNDVQSGKAKPIGPASPVEKATNNKSSSSSFSKADLTPEQLVIMNQFVRSGIMTEEAYINDIAKMQG